MGDTHFEKLERMYGGAPINGFFRPTLRVADGEATLSMEIDEGQFHSAGAAHGCVAFKALDDATFFAAQSLVLDRFVVTVSFQLHLLRPILRGSVEARGRVVHSSKQILVADGELSFGGQVVARGTGTFMKSAVALDEKVGYR